MSNSIPLHPKYGVNPTMPTCIVCGKDTGEIALLGNHYKGEAPMHMVCSIEPCDKCHAEYLTNGTMLAEAETDWKLSKPRRIPTGRVMILKDEAFTRMFNQKTPTGKIVMCEVGVIQKIEELNRHAK